MSAQNPSANSNEPAVLRRGGCLCGAVRYEARGEPVHASLCHCPSCRRAAGAPAVAWAMFAASDVRFEGTAPVTFASSPGVERQFCGRCGTPVAYISEALPGMIDLTAATFDAPEDLPPAVHIFVAHRLPWWNTLGELPEFAELPEAPKD